MKSLKELISLKKLIIIGAIAGTSLFNPLFSQHKNTISGKWVSGSTTYQYKTDYYDKKGNLINSLCHNRYSKRDEVDPSYGNLNFSNKNNNSYTPKSNNFT